MLECDKTLSLLIILVILMINKPYLCFYVKRDCCSMFMFTRQDKQRNNVYLH